MGKVKITFAVTLTAVMGYVLSEGVLDLKALIVFLGTFVLSIGSMALNQIQEIPFDAVMGRTKDRPLPSNKIKKENAWYLAIIFIALGLYILVEYLGLKPFFFGFVTMVLYNFVYTPLKRKTNFAVIPGAIVGVFPPFIGWTASNGNYLDPMIVMFGMFIFVWQMPHFWILLLNYKDEYKAAGYPIIMDKLPLDQVKRMILIWVLTLSFVSLFFPYVLQSGAVNKIMLAIINISLSADLIYKMKKLLYQEQLRPKTIFRKLNVYVLLILTIVVIEKVINKIIS